MRLSEKIMELRKNSGWSQEELADRLGISRQSVSKWETGESMPDIDKIIRMSELWNVSTDYLLKENSEPWTESFRENPQSGTGERADEDHENEDDADDQGQTQTQGFDWNDHSGYAGRSRRRTVSFEEAEDFLTLSRKAAPRIALGVLLCILSPVCLMMLGALSEKIWSFGGVVVAGSEHVAGAVGMCVLLLLVAIAVALFITTGMSLSRYEYMEKELLDLPDDLFHMVFDEKEQFEPAFRSCITIGVVLCIVGAIPLLALSMFTDDDLLLVIGLCITLVFVSVGVFLGVYAGTIHGSFEKLLQTGDYTPGKKRMESLSGVYWCLVVAVYFIYSFVSGHWGSSWMIFPVAGVLFGAIRAVAGAVFK